RYCSAIALPRRNGTGLPRSDPSADVKTNWRAPAARAASMRLRLPCSSTVWGLSSPPRCGVRHSDDDIDARAGAIKRRPVFEVAQHRLGTARVQGLGGMR